MTPNQMNGPLASVRKYDLITGLGCYALAQNKHVQRTVLRLITLVTARYNWRRDELSAGRREIARLWHVDERTVKREMARLKALGWITVKRAGVRGRVTTYALDHDALEAATRTMWSAVGADFEDRMTGPPQPPSNVVAMPGAAAPLTAVPLDGSEWSYAAAEFSAENPAIYRAWVSALKRKGRVGGELTLTAPSPFHKDYVETKLIGKLLSAVRAVDPEVTTVAITLPDEPSLRH